MYILIASHKKVVITLIFIIVIAGFLTYSFVSPQGMFSGLSKDLENITPSSEFSYTDLDGTIVDLSAFKGKPLIINSWATWIPFSQKELQLFNTIKEKHGDALTILAINRMENNAVIKSYLDTFAISRTILFLTDPSDHFYKAVGGYAMPETVFYDKDGLIRAHIRGVITESELTELVDTLIST